MFCNLTSSVKWGDGIGPLKWLLQAMYASATPANRAQALQQLYEFQMHSKEAVINFGSHFRNQIQALSNTSIDASSDMPAGQELATFLFLDKLFPNNNIIGNDHHVLLDYWQHKLNSSNGQHRRVAQHRGMIYEYLSLEIQSQVWNDQRCWKHD